VTILLSSHLLVQVQSVCDRVGIFAAGRLIGLGTVPELAAEFGADKARVEVAFESAAGESDDRIRSALKTIPDVTDVQPAAAPEEPWILTVEPATADRRVREAVLAMAATQQLGLTSIRSVSASLDEIYRTALETEGLAA
jgi:ABC-2 type transport system ATP-binding protein